MATKIHVEMHKLNRRRAQLPFRHSVEPVETLEEATEPDDPLADLSWQDWLTTMYPAYVSHAFGDHHEDFWEHIKEVTSQSLHDPFVAIWARAGGKSSSIELACAFLGLRNRRAYILYISGTQEQADDHVSNIGALLEESTVGEHYEEHAGRKVDKYGSSKGWRRNRLRTAGGLTVDAIGLDTAGRGVKLEAQRPDVLIFDDIDGEHDGSLMTKKKIKTITRKLLPSGARNVLVICGQNVIIPNGFFARMRPGDGRADYLATRVVSGPIPALRGLKTIRVKRSDGKWIDEITAGEPTWVGQNVEDCQAEINLFGKSAFLEECQHEVDEREGALWKRVVINASRRGSVHEGGYIRIGIGVDPSGGAAEWGIVVAGVRHDGHIDVLEDGSVPGSLGPNHAGARIVHLYAKWKADFCAVEFNFGGEMAESTIQTIDSSVNVQRVHASRGKLVRAEPIASLYGSEEVNCEDSQVHHVGTFAELETEMTSYIPGEQSPNRLDALVWVLTQLSAPYVETQYDMRSF